MAKGAHYGLCAWRSPDCSPCCVPRHGRLAATGLQTGKSGPPLGPRGLEPAQPLGQKGTGMQQSEG